MTVRCTSNQLPAPCLIENGSQQGSEDTVLVKQLVSTTSRSILAEQVEIDGLPEEMPQQTLMDHVIVLRQEIDQLRSIVESNEQEV